MTRVGVCYLYKEDNDEVEVGYPPELLKQILGDKVPNGILKERGTQKEERT